MLDLQLADSAMEIARGIAAAGAVARLAAAGDLAEALGAASALAMLLEDLERKAEALAEASTARLEGVGDHD